MKTGEDLLITIDGRSDLCCITEITSDSVIVKLLKKDYNATELPIKITLFQGICKGEKMDFVIQKAAELGVYEIVPTDMKRCIAKSEPNKAKQKTERFNLISESASKQSKRNVIPKVSEPMSFTKALDYAKTLDMLIVPYECESGMQGTKEALSKIEAFVKSLKK